MKKRNSQKKCVQQKSLKRKNIDKAKKVLSLKKKKSTNKRNFERGIYKYHGRIKIFAETLRKNGMEF